MCVYVAKFAIFFVKKGVLILFFALICSIAPTGDLLFAYLAPLEWSYFTYSIGAS